MVAYILDASAVLRFLDREAGSERVGEILEEHAEGSNQAAISSIQWGEVVGVLGKRVRSGGDPSAIETLRSLRLAVIPVDAQRAERSATIKSAFALSYMDSFAVELALDSPERILVTADFDFKPAQHEVHIEFLPAKAA